MEPVDISLILSAALPSQTDLNRVRDARDQQRRTLAATGGFSPISLTDWIDLCQKAGIPHIPAEIIAEVPVDTFLEFDKRPSERDQDKPSLDEILKKADDDVAKLMQSDGQKRMIRWDACAGADIKYALSNGETDWQPDFALAPGPGESERTFEAQYINLPKTSFNLLVRPWIKARIVDGYPLEFRVYVENDEVVATSSYYPQRPLQPTKEILEYVEQAQALTRMLISHVQKPVVYMEQWVSFDEPNETGHQEAALNATCDFLAAEDGQMLFIEGGPDMARGAHPCCFLGREKLEGIALTALEAEKAPPWHACPNDGGFDNELGPLGCVLTAQGLPCHCQIGSEEKAGPAT